MDYVDENKLKKKANGNNQAFVFPCFKIKSNLPLCFTDCGFIGNKKIDGIGTDQNTKYQVFSDRFCRLNLHLQNCYFKNLNSIAKTNFSPRNFQVIESTFESITEDGLCITHPQYLVIRDNRFIDISQMAVQIKIFDSSSTRSGPVKQTIIEGNEIQNCYNGIRLKSNKKRYQFMRDKVRISRNKLYNLGKNGIILENCLFSEIIINENKLKSCGFSGVVLINSKTNDQIIMNENIFYLNSKLSICLENTMVDINQNSFACGGGAVWINFCGLVDDDEKLDDGPPLIDYDDYTIIRKDQSERDRHGHNDKDNFSGNKEITITFENMIMMMNRAIIRDCLFEKMKKYAVMVACNAGGVVKISKIKVKNSDMGIFINEICKGTLGYNNEKKNNEAEDTTLRSLITDRNCQKPVLMATKGQILVENCVFENTNRSINKKSVLSQLYVDG